MLDKKRSIKEKIENNIVVWTLCCLLAGFLAGFGAYKTIFEITRMEIISKDKLNDLKIENKDLRNKIKNLKLDEADKLSDEKRFNPMEKDFNSIIKIIKKTEKYIEEIHFKNNLENTG